jgi:hypothetical protein
MVDWYQVGYQWAVVLGLAALFVLFLLAAKWVPKLFASLPSLSGFLVIALWVVLVVLGRVYEGEDTIVRIYILFGAIGMMSAARWAARMFYPDEWKAIENMRWW